MDRDVETLSNEVGRQMATQIPQTDKAIFHSYFARCRPRLTQIPIDHFKMQLVLAHIRVRQRHCFIQFNP